VGHEFWCGSTEVWVHHSIHSIIASDSTWDVGDTPPAGTTDSIEESPELSWQLHLAIKYAQEGRVSRAVQALEAAELAPATAATLKDLVALHPAALPRDCIPKWVAVVALF
jgi:hypothetical protein